MIIIMIMSLGLNAILLIWWIFKIRPVVINLRLAFKWRSEALDSANKKIDHLAKDNKKLKNMWKKNI